MVGFIKWSNTTSEIQRSNFGLSMDCPCTQIISSEQNWPSPFSSLHTIPTKLWPLNGAKALLMAFTGFEKKATAETRLQLSVLKKR